MVKSFKVTCCNCNFLIPPSVTQTFLNSETAVTVAGTPLTVAVQSETLLKLNIKLTLALLKVPEDTSVLPPILEVSKVLRVTKEPNVLFGFIIRP